MGYETLENKLTEDFKRMILNSPYPDTADISCICRLMAQLAINSTLKGLLK